MKRIVHWLLDIPTTAESDRDADADSCSDECNSGSSGSGSAGDGAGENGEAASLAEERQESASAPSGLWRALASVLFVHAAAAPQQGEHTQYPSSVREQCSSNTSSSSRRRGLSFLARVRGRTVEGGAAGGDPSSDDASACSSSCSSCSSSGAPTEERRGWGRWLQWRSIVADRDHVSHPLEASEGSQDDGSGRRGDHTRTAVVKEVKEEPRQTTNETPSGVWSAARRVRDLPMPSFAFSFPPFSSASSSSSCAASSVSPGRHGGGGGGAMRMQSFPRATAIATPAPSRALRLGAMVEDLASHQRPLIGHDNDGDNDDDTAGYGVFCGGKGAQGTPRWQISAPLMTFGDPSMISVELGLLPQEHLNVGGTGQGEGFATDRWRAGPGEKNAWDGACSEPRVHATSNWAREALVVEYLDSLEAAPPEVELALESSPLLPSYKTTHQQGHPAFSPASAATANAAHVGRLPSPRSPSLPTEAFIVKASPHPPETVQEAHPPLNEASAALAFASFPQGLLSCPEDHTMDEVLPSAAAAITPVALSELNRAFGECLNGEGTADTTGTALPTKRELTLAEAQRLRAQFQAAMLE